MLTIWWCPCVESSLVLLEEGVCYDQCILLGKTLLAFALLPFVLQGQTCLLLQVSFDFLLLYSSFLWWKGHLFLVLVLEDLVGLHKTIQLQLFQHYWLGHRLWLLWYWMTCIRNDQRSFCHFWDCTSDSSVDYEGYSISSKGFLPTVVGIMVICRVYEDLQDLLEQLKRRPFHYRGLECKSRKSRNTWSNRQIWPWTVEWSRAKTNSFAKKMHWS